jgi:hypothetical protein
MDDRPDGGSIQGLPEAREDGPDAVVEGVGADGAGDSLGGVTAEPLGDDHEGAPTGDGDQPGPKPPSRHGVAFALLRALVVLVVAAVAYQLVVPTAHVVRTRLSRLVLTKPGVAAYDKTKPQAGEQNDTQTGIAALTTAAKRAPNQTGLYSIEWSATQISGAGTVAFLLPSDSVAATALSQIRSQQLAAGSYSSNSLTRDSTYAVPGVPGSYAAIYRPAAKDAKSVPSLAVTVFRYGRVVAVDEAASVGSTAQPAANTITVGELQNLRRQGTGFSLSVTRYPVVATTLWWVAAVVLAALAALVPVARRRRAQRRQRAEEEELAHRVVVGKQVIVKHRR